MMKGWLALKTKSSLVGFVKTSNKMDANRTFYKFGLSTDVLNYDIYTIQCHH